MLSLRRLLQKRKFWAGYPCGRPVENFGQPLQVLEKQALWHRRPARLVGACLATGNRVFATGIDSSGKKKSTKINFLGPETARWGGGLPREGEVAKKFVPSLESLSSLGFEGRNLGCPWNFAGMSRTPAGVQKVSAKKVRAHFPNSVSKIVLRFCGCFCLISVHTFMV